VKVGIWGPGFISCTTRYVAGAGVPQITAIHGGSIRTANTRISTLHCRHQASGTPGIW